MKDKDYCLSPKDLCTIDFLPQIIEAGVYSLKIEGRMKRAEYTAGVTEIYRKYVCGENLRQHPHHAAESGQQMGTVCQPRTGRAGSAGDQNDCFEPGIPGSFRRNETDPYEP